MESLGFTAIPAIMVICYLIAQTVKATALDNKWLPIICGISGAWELQRCGLCRSMAQTTR